MDLSEAVNTGNLKALQEILREPGCQINEYITHKDNYIFNRTETTSLNVSASRGDVDCMQALIDAGADLEIKESSGNTPLYTAAELNKVECIKALLNAGANLEAKANDGSTPLHTSAANNHTEVCQHLINAGADINALDEYNNATANCSYIWISKYN